MSLIIAYIPVLHAGYLEFLDQAITANTDTLWLIDPIWARKEFIELDYLRKEIRLVQPDLIKTALMALYPNLSINILCDNSIKQARLEISGTVVVANEDVSKILTAKYFPNLNLDIKPIFLRWDKSKVDQIQEVGADEQISDEEFDKQVMNQTFVQAGLSTDWWRHVGAILVKNKQVILRAYNTHTPTEQTQYINGDPRTLANTGKKIEISTTVHAEGVILAEAAKNGIITQGADLFVTTFPCPYCARLVARAGIARLFFCEGYSILDGENELKREGVKIIRVVVNKKTIETQNRNSLVKQYS